ncbi:hypothetical protein HZA56_14280 [Candidatus Poribacteria bacterium]|nr:hypothetical protein [Candidatus Poribacteria bacterium]
MKVLHIIRSNDDRLAHRFIDQIGRLDTSEQTILMIQDGVYVRPKGPKVFACAEDVLARGIETDVALVDYDRIVEMVFEADKVITW